MRRKSKTLSELRPSLLCLINSFSLLRKDVYGKKIVNEISIIQEKACKKGKIYLKEYCEKSKKKFCEKNDDYFFFWMRFEYFIFFFRPMLVISGFFLPVIKWTRRAFALRVV